MKYNGTMVSISLILPSRERPEKFNRLISSLNQTTSNLSSIELISIHDHDDNTFKKIAFHKCKFRNFQIKTRQSSMGYYNSECLKHSSGKSIILINDDVLFRTKGWDILVDKLFEKYSDGIYLGYGNDLFKGKKLPTFPILSKKFINLIKDPYPSNYKGAFIDMHLNDIFNIILKKHVDRYEYLNELEIEHLHYRTGKSDIDSTYLKRDRFGDDDTFLINFNLRVKHANKILKKLGSKNKANHVNIDLSSTVAKIITLFKIYILSKNYTFMFGINQFIYFVLRTIYIKIRNIRISS